MKNKIFLVSLSFVIGLILSIYLPNLYFYGALFLLAIVFIMSWGPRRLQKENDTETYSVLSLLTWFSLGYLLSGIIKMFV